MHTTLHKIITEKKIKALFDFAISLYQDSLYDYTNQALNNGALLSDKSCIETYARDFLTRFHSSDDKKEHEPELIVLQNYFITNYIDIFVTSKNTPTKGSMADAMLTFYDQNLDAILDLPCPTTNSTAILPDEETIVLTGSDKKYILRESHASYFSATTNFVQIKRSAGVSSYSVDDVVQSSELLRTEFQSLIAFDQIKAISKKKTLIQEVMKTYIKQVILIYALDKELISQAIGQIHSALGAQQTKNLFNQLYQSSAYPTSLDMIDSISEELRNTIRGIDLFLHVPDTLIDSSPLVRNYNTWIRQEITTNNRQTAGKNDSNSNNLPKPTQTSDSSAQNPFLKSDKCGFFAPLAQQINNLQIYKQRMHDYKTKCIAENTNSNNLLFTSIARSLPVTKDLMANKNSVLIKDSYGNSALYLAALVGNNRAFPTLKAYNFSVSEKNTEGLPLLHLAILGDNAEIVASLLEKDPQSIHMTNSAGMDAYLFAINVCPKDSKITSLILESPNFNVSKTYNL